MRNGFMGAVCAAAVLAAAMATGSAAAHAESPAAGSDINGKTVFLKPGAWLRFGESLLAERYVSNGTRNLAMKGRGSCTSEACPVTFNGESLYARRSRLELDPEGRVSDGKGSATAGESAITRTLRRGDEGDDVRALQRALNETGLTVKVDGKYGRGTEEAVREFQRKAGIKRDGVLGPETRRRLLG